MCYKVYPTYLIPHFPFINSYLKVNLIPHTSGRRISPQNRWQILISHFKTQTLYFVIICDIFSLKRGVFFFCRNLSLFWATKKQYKNSLLYCFIICSRNFVTYTSVKISEFERLKIGIENARKPWFYWVCRVSYSLWLLKLA